MLNAGQISHLRLNQIRKITEEILGVGHTKRAYVIETRKHSLTDYHLTIFCELQSRSRLWESNVSCFVNVCAYQSQCIMTAWRSNLMCVQCLWTCSVVGHLGALAVLRIWILSDDRGCPASQRHMLESLWA